MKNICIVILISMLILCGVENVYAQNPPQPTLQVSKRRIQQREQGSIWDEAQRLPDYVKYYSIYPYDTTMYFKELNKSDIKKLTKTEKKYYKHIAKIEKYLSQGRYNDAIYKDRNFLPTYVTLYNISRAKNDYQNALYRMYDIIKLNEKDNVLDNKTLYFKLGILYYATDNYEYALQYLQPYIDEQKDDVGFRYTISDIHYHPKNYSSCIFYAKDLLNTKNHNAAVELLYSSYVYLGNKLEANKYALELCKIYPNSTNHLRVAALTNDFTKKLTYYYKARNLAIEEKDTTNLILADSEISKIEQNKINVAMKRISGFVEKPDWSKIENEISSIERTINVSNRQYEFFKSTNSCISKYSGNNLAKCFEAVNKKQEKLTQDLKVSYQRAYEQNVRDMEYRRQQALIEQQNYNNMLYLNQLQSIQNQPRRTHCYRVGSHVYCDSY